MIIPVTARRPRILLIHLEFPSWNAASKMAYSTSWAIEEGLIAIGADVVMIPGITVQTAAEMENHSPQSWLKHAKTICTGRTFDQVWVEACHMNYDDEFLDWVAKLAPVRVALVTECLSYDDEALRLYPYLARRQQFVLNRMKFFTHALTIDERDAPYMNALGIVPSLYWCHAVPSRCLTLNNQPVLTPFGIFIGSPYGERMKYLSDSTLKPLLRHLPSPEDGTPIAALFDKFGSVTQQRLSEEHVFDGALFETYVSGVRRLRRLAYDTWLETLRGSAALVCLPQLGNAFSNRPFDGMAAGRPVVHFRLPPNSYSSIIFEENEEWLLYSSLEELRDKLDRVLHDKELSRRLSERGFDKIRRCHLLERRMTDIQKWITDGSKVSPIGGPIIPEAEQLERAQNFRNLAVNVQSAQT